MYILRKCSIQGYFATRIIFYYRFVASVLKDVGETGNYLKDAE
jgi:hypothetical protein